MGRARRGLRVVASAEVRAPDAAFADPRLAPLLRHFRRRPQRSRRLRGDRGGARRAQRSRRRLRHGELRCAARRPRSRRRRRRSRGRVARRSPAPSPEPSASAGSKETRRRLPPLAVDLATMTGNVAQAIVEPEDWTARSLASRRAASRRLPRLRDARPGAPRWEEWTREATHESSRRRVLGELSTWPAPRLVPGDVRPPRRKSAALRFDAALPRARRGRDGPRGARL